MNKEKQIRKQTWKFFWQQKWDETKDVFFGLSAISCIAFFFYICATAEQGNWQGIILIIVGLLVILSVIVGLSYALYLWVKENWKRAERRAKAKYKSKMTTKR